MKKKVYLGMAVFALAMALFFCVLTGRQFFSMMSGPKLAEAGISLEEMEGQYITYSAAHPIAAFAEEYYSGDADRIKRMAYVIYDEERQALLKVIVSEQKKGKFDKLMKAVNRSPELKESWGDMQASEERPVEVTGSVMPIEESEEIRQIEEAMAGGDSYSTEEMEKLAISQTQWYVLEDKRISGLSASHLWICAIAAGVNVLILFLCLIMLTKKKGTAGFGAGVGDTVGELMEQQRTWLTPWCETARKRQVRLGVLSLAGCIAGLTALGIFVGYDLLEVMTCHLPIGVIVGDLCAVCILLGADTALNPDKILKNCRRNLERALPDKEERERAAREFLEAADEWAVLEKNKENIRYGIAGEHYWVVFTGKGMATVVDADRIGRITSETVTGQYRSGKIRMNYTYYTVNIGYRDSGKKKGDDVILDFDFEETAGHFMVLARKRLKDMAENIIR